MQPRLPRIPGKGRQRGAGKLERDKPRVRQPHVQAILGLYRSIGTCGELERIAAIDERAEEARAARGLGNLQSEHPQRGHGVSAEDKTLDIRVK